MDLCKKALDMLGEKYSVKEEMLGNDAHMDKSGMHFHVRSFQIEGIGHLCDLSMTGMLGMMKMDTLVIAPVNVDMPLFNMDDVKAMGNETFIVEMYDTMLEPMKDEVIEAYVRRKNADHDIPDYDSGSHWYDDLLMKTSYHKKGKKLTGRFDCTADDYLGMFLKDMENAPLADAAKKLEKNRFFAQSLLDHGGPAVDQVTKMFGRQAAEKLILKYMYGVEESR